jgi:hypothetical protein
MAKRILAFLALSLALFVTPNWAQDCSVEGNAITCPFSPDQPTSATYEFGNNGRLVVKFDTVLTTFNLTVTAVNAATIPNFDTAEFPATTVCVTYFGNGGTCVHYDFSGVPVKNVDYKGLITLTLSYRTQQTINTPAFAHAPGDNVGAIYTENILTSYSAEPLCTGCDPTMGGKVPNLSSVAAFDEPLVNASTFCSLTLASTTVGNDQKPQVEATLKISSSCGGTGLRDKTASLSVSATDSNGNVSFHAIKNAEGNKFHWDNNAGLNEYDISLEGLTPTTVSAQTYTVTAFSSRFSPQSAAFCVDSSSHVTIGSCPP